MLKTVQLINTSAFGNGTVTQVQGNGTVNGITLTGNVTSSGNITLGGTLGSIANSQLSNSSITIGNTTISLGGTATSLGNIALANVSTTGLTGYLYGNDGTGNVTASTTIPNTGLANSTITLGNATLTLGSTTSTVGNLTLANVTITSGTENNVTYTNATISSVKTTFPNSFLTNNSVTIGNTSVSLGSTVTSFGNVTLTNATISSLSTPITTAEGGTGLTSVTAGYIPFGSTSNALSTDSNLFWDATNHRLGIGTTSPASFLHVNGGSTAPNSNSVVRVDTTATTSYSANSYVGGQIRINFGNATNSYGGINFTNFGATSQDFFGVVQNSSGYDDFVWQGYSGTAGQYVEDMRLTNAGNLLIGYTSSNGSYKLQVNSQIFATSSTIATSDANYKTNVTPLTGSLTLVNKLNPVSFNWKKHAVHDFDTKNVTVGFLAQEVQTALSETNFVNSIIKESICTITDEVKDEAGNVITPAVIESFLGIVEGNMISILTKAIQELSAQVTTLQSQVASLTPKA